MAEIKDGPFDGRRGPEVTDPLSRLAAAFQVDGIVSAWPDDGWPDTEAELAEFDDEEWIVGIALKRFGGSESYAVKFGDQPNAWREFAKVRGRKLAEAFAELLNAARGQAEGR
jgi:hypothetical protein